MSDKKIALATWIGGSAEHTINGETLVQGVQREVPAAVAKRLEAEFPAQCVVVHTTAGSKEDVRVPDYVVPPQPEEEPETPDWPTSAPEALEVLDPLDETPLEPSPKAEE